MTRLPWEVAGAPSRMMALAPAYAGLNAEQRAAIRALLTARDYLCVLGMPGTGKTSMIAFAVAALVAAGKSVLITSHTHTAVDNLLLKLVSDGVDVLRVGALGSIHPALRRFSLDGAIADGAVATVGEMRARCMEAPVVGVTCLGVDSHPVFCRRAWDVVIVDEAGQIPEPVALGPLRLANVFVLVGDPAQLPPLVLSPVARAAGMGVSLLERLVAAHPAAVVRLTQQYRMNTDIQRIANTLVYDHALVCGAPSVAARRLTLPMPSALPPPPPRTDHWLATALDPARSVVFLDTDAAGTSAPSYWEGGERGAVVNDGTGSSSSGGGGGERVPVVNAAEVAVVALLVRSLLAAGIAGADIGVIAPYNAQVHALRAALRASASTPTADVEVETVDRYQGRDKPAILMSLTRSNAGGAVGAILQQLPRLNVAFTRAKCKLVLVGSRTTVTRGSDPLRALLDLASASGWMLPLPPGSLIRRAGGLVTTTYDDAVEPPAAPPAPVTPATAPLPPMSPPRPVLGGVGGSGRVATMFSTGRQRSIDVDEAHVAAGRALLAVVAEGGVDVEAATATAAASPAVSLAPPVFGGGGGGGGGAVTPQQQAAAPEAGPGGSSAGKRGRLGAVRRLLPLPPPN